MCVRFFALRGEKRTQKKIKCHAAGSLRNPDEGQAKSVAFRKGIDKCLIALEGCAQPYFCLDWPSAHAA